MEGDLTELLDKIEKISTKARRDVQLAKWLVVIAAICVAINLGVLLHGNC